LCSGGHRGTSPVRTETWGGWPTGPAQFVARICESLPLFDLVTPMPYVELQKLLDEANVWGVHA